ncbi:hypothetical protein LINPERHAP2_LOCUS19784 [Linum perenne]
MPCLICFYLCFVLSVHLLFGCYFEAISLSIGGVFFVFSGLGIVVLVTRNT